MDMRMVQQFLIPGVQHAEEADLGAEMSRVARYRQQCLGAGPKQQPVHLAFVL
jgi:hypothetical protein